MGKEFTFYDYFDADGSGVNVIRTWLNGAGKPAKMFFNLNIEHLEASPPARFADSLWKPPTTKLLQNKRDKWHGFIEIRKLGKVQYRLIAQVIDRNVFLVATGIHKGRHYETDISPSTASNRVNQMLNNPAKYRREHEYD